MDQTGVAEAGVSDLTPVADGGAVETVVGTTESAAPPPVLTLIRTETNPAERVRQLTRSHPVPEQWRKELEAMSPPSLRTTFLQFGWFEGTDKHPAKRWVIYEMVPVGLIPPDKREQLGGTPYWKMPKGMQEGRRRMVSAYQWEMYRKHRVWARPFWCLQGDQGGTPARYSDLEKNLLRIVREPTDPPAPGALPYAEWDSRARSQIEQRDRLRQFDYDLERLKASGSTAAIKAEEEAMEKEFRRRFLTWLKDRTAPQADFLDWYTKKTESDMVLRKATPGEETAIAMAEDVFIETGALPHAADAPVYNTHSREVDPQWLPKK